MSTEDPNLPTDTFTDMRPVLGAFRHPPVTYTYKTISDKPVELDLYRPKTYEAGKKYRTLICWHGGGACSGTRWMMSPMNFVKLLLQKGYVMVFPDFRLMPEAVGWDLLEDVGDLEKWINDKGEELGIDKEKVVVAGASSGAYNAALASLYWKTVPPKVFLSFYGMMDIASPWYTEKKSPGPVLAGLPSDLVDSKLFEDCLQPYAEHVWHDPRPLKKRATIFFWALREGRFLELLYGKHRGVNVSKGRDEGLLIPLKNIREGFPPTMAVHGEVDSVIPIANAKALMDACEKAGVKHELCVVENAEHGFDTEEIALRAYDFTESVLKC